MTKQMQVSCAAKDRPEAAAGPNALLAAAVCALWTDGDARRSGDWFDAAYTAAERSRDGEAMALAALGLAGLWVQQHRASAASAILRDRLRRALALVDSSSSLARRLRARLAAETDHGAGQATAILAVLHEARESGDTLATAEALHLAQECLMGPDRAELRRDLAEELMAHGPRTGRRLDLLLGVVWHTVNLVLAGSPHAHRALAELRGLLAVEEHVAVEPVVRAIDVMLEIRAGHFERAERRAKECAEQGDAIGDASALAWYATQLTAIRWFQGRVGELVALLTDVSTAPSLSAVDNSSLAALALAAASAGDHRRATTALARLRGSDLADAPRSTSWLVTLFAAVEAAHLLRDTGTAARAYELLLPFAGRPAVASLGVACLGSVQHALGVAALTTGDVQGAVEHLRGAVRDNVALGHWPAATLSRYRLATALSQLGAADARAELAAARQDAAEFGMVLPEGPERRSARPSTPDPRELRIERQGRHWHLHTGERTVVVEDCRGLAYLAMLVANPSHEIEALELAAGPGALAAAAELGSTGRAHQPVLDQQAIGAYRQRLGALQAEIERADAAGDQDRAVRAHAERDWLLAELRTATGLVGRARAFATTDERARVAVGKAIRRALERIRRADAGLGDWLAAATQTGRRCCYRPGPAVGS